MALRVLLADESSAIKRVMELSLQDYAVDVRTVNIGTDVLHIAKSFNPDIIFVDILLQKLSGYEVSQLLKADPQFQRTPVVLMWSGFMDFDAAKYKSSQADAKLEKPFNGEILRKIVQDLVHKTKTQSLSNFIQLPDFIDDPSKPALEVEEINFSPKPPPVETSTPKWNMDSFQSIESFAQKTQPQIEAPEEFAQVRLGKKQANNFSPDDFPSPESWIKQDLNSFKAPPPIDEEKSLMDSLKESHADLTHERKVASTTKSKKPLVLEDITPEQIQPHNNVDTSKIESMVSAQVKQTIETVAWRIVPEIAERIIREEINRLLKDKENEVGLE